jgi:hypothetical protein
LVIAKNSTELATAAEAIRIGVILERTAQPINTTSMTLA